MLVLYAGHHVQRTRPEIRDVNLLVTLSHNVIRSAEVVVGIRSELIPVSRRPVPPEEEERGLMQMTLSQHLGEQLAEKAKRAPWRFRWEPTYSFWFYLTDNSL